MAEEINLQPGHEHSGEYELVGGDIPSRRFDPHAVPVTEVIKEGHMGMAGARGTGGMGEGGMQGGQGEEMTGSTMGATGLEESAKPGQGEAMQGHEQGGLGSGGSAQETSRETPMD